MIFCKLQKLKIKEISYFEGLFLHKFSKRKKERFFFCSNFLKIIFLGATMATSRAILMTIGQLSFYDQIKQMLIQSGYAKDNLATHFFSSFCAVSR